MVRIWVFFRATIVPKPSTDNIITIYSKNNCKTLIVVVVART